MYDYVLQYGFDINSRKTIQGIKDYLKRNGVEDKERKWLPHITIDLYNCKNQNEFIKKIDNIVSNINSFELNLKNLNDFNKETLYIEPFNKKELLDLKLLFNEKLDDYRLDNRIIRTYMPHITLCTNDNIDDSIYTLAKQKFNPFLAKVKYIWIYNQQMELIKEYDLENSNKVRE